MARGRRSDFLLAGLGLVAVANGLFLGLTLYGLLAAALKLVGAHSPSSGLAWLAGALAGSGLLVLALQREQALRQGAYGPWTLRRATSLPELRLEQRFEALAAASSLELPPALLLLDSPDPNAFAMGRSREEASVVLTTGLLRVLRPPEQDAVLLHELAQVESDDLRAVGLADAIADAIADLSRSKGRLLWGPRAIVTDMLPLILISLVGLAVVAAEPEGGVAAA